MKLPLFISIFGVVLLASCTRTTRIGHTRYPIGTASAQHTPVAKKPTKPVFKAIPRQDVPVYEVNKCLVPESTSPATPEAFQYHAIKVNRATASSNFAHEAKHLCPPNSSTPLDTGKVLSRSGTLLRIANISYTVNMVSIVAFLVSFLIFVLFLAGTFVSSSTADITFILVVCLYFFGLVSLVASITWLTSALLFWIIYGKQYKLIRSFEETKRRYIYHLVTLAITALALLIQLVHTFYLRFF